MFKFSLVPVKHGVGASDHSFRGARKVLCVTGDGIGCRLGGGRGHRPPWPKFRTPLPGPFGDRGWYVARPALQRYGLEGAGSGGSRMVACQSVQTSGTVGVDTHSGVAGGVRDLFPCGVRGPTPRR